MVPPVVGVFVMKLINIIWAMAVFSMAGCASTTSQIPDTVSVGVYAETDAIHAGRYDLAEQYGDNLLRIVPAPKKRTAVAPVTKSVAATPTAPATLTKVNVTPLDAGKLTYNIQADAPALDGLLEVPGAVAAQAAADDYQKQVDAQQKKDADDKAAAVAQVAKDKETIAAAAKWKYMVITAISLFVVSVLVYVAWKLKWIGL